MYKKDSLQLQVCYLCFLCYCPTVARDSYKWVSYKKGFGCWLVMVGVGGYTLDGGGWWWVVEHIFWLVVGGGGYLWLVVDSSGWWWTVVGSGHGGGWWHGLV